MAKKHAAKLAKFKKDMIKVVEFDDDPDLSWLQTEYKTSGGKITKIVSSCRYSDDDIKTHGQEVLKWIKQDHDRLDAYKSGEWHMIGIRAKLNVELPIGNGNTREMEFVSAGLWGIESDSDDEYIDSVFEEECDQLLSELATVANIFS